MRYHLTFVDKKLRYAYKLLKQYVNKLFKHSVNILVYGAYSILNVSQIDMMHISQTVKKSMLTNNHITFV